MGSRLISVVGRAVLAGLCVFLSSEKTRGDEPFVVHLLISDGVGMSRVVAEDARQSVERIFGRLNVAVAWLDSSCARCRQDAHSDEAAYRAFMKSIYVIRLVGSASAQSGPGASVRALGYAAPGTRVVTIVFPLVRQKAESAGGSVALALGHVVGHELGHLLLRQHGHSATGLMQAELDMRLAEQGRLLFTDTQARAIRATLSGDGVGTP